MQFDVGYSFIFVILLTLMINTGLIVFRTLENWRHRRNVELNRLLVLEQFEKLKTAEMADSDKKAEKLRARNDFIMRRMLEAEPVETVKALPKSMNRTPAQINPAKMQTIKEEGSHESSFI